MSAFWFCNCRHPNTKVWYADDLEELKKARLPQVLKCYSDKAVRDAIEQILSPEWKPGPQDPDTWTKADLLFSIIQTIETSAYSAGMREVQQGIIKALDLRHLLGLHGR